MNISENKLYARKCEIKVLSNKEIKDFVDENDIKGHINGSINIALFNKNEIISVMVFGKTKVRGLKKNDYDLLRYCCKNG